MTKKVAEFWTADAETTPFHNCVDPFCPLCHGEGRVPEPFVWGLYNGLSEEYYEFETMHELAEFMRPRKTVVYAHNGGRFDWHFARDEINSDENLMVIAGRLAKFKIGECEYRDSMNIFQATRLKDFGNKLEIDYALMEPWRRMDPNVKAEISKYLRVDVVDLWNQLYRYFEEYGRGLTQAGASMRIWSNMAKIKPPQQTKEQFKRYKPYYYGGRVECFRTGIKKESFDTVDMNSAYPNAMMQKHAFSPAGTMDDRLPTSESEIARSLITLTCVSEGAFPYRKDTGELIFPHDEKFRRYHVTGWEFLAALEFDAARGVQIEEVHTFPFSIDFAEYIQHFYEQRKLAKARGDLAQNIFAKLFMNSLYGKFGSNPGGCHIDEDDNPADGYQEYVIATDESIAKWVPQGYRNYKPWGERTLMLRALPEERHKYFNVATAASITGFQRAALFRASRQCEGLIYTDTDSITARDVSRLSLGNELGQWKVELSGKFWAVAGKKNYTLQSADDTINKYHGFQSREEGTGPWKIASKGARLTPEEMIRVASGREYECEVCRKTHAGVCYRPQSPTFSISRNVPKFIDRKIRLSV